MANDLYDEAIIDVLSPEALLSKTYAIKVLDWLLLLQPFVLPHLGSHTQ